MDDLLVELQVFLVHPDNIKQLGLPIVVLSPQILYLLRGFLELAPQLFVYVSQTYNLYLSICNIGT